MGSGKLVFGSLGFTEIAFILILALLLFGPKRLPEIGKTIGKGLAEFRRASNELKRTLESEVADQEVSERAARRPASPLAPVPPATDPIVPGSDQSVPQAVEPPPSERAGEDRVG
jgi:TatA/E family protein of Tat protein translocase